MNAWLSGALVLLTLTLLLAKYLTANGRINLRPGLFRVEQLSMLKHESAHIFFLHAVAGRWLLLGRIQVSGVTTTPNFYGSQKRRLPKHIVAAVCVKD